MSCAKLVEWKPLTGLTDTRSTPDEVAFGHFRYVQNMYSPAINKRCRRPGWEKLFTVEEGYTNSDLHNQLLDLLNYNDDCEEQVFDTLTPVITSGAVSYFDFGNNFGPGVYEIRYVEGALKYAAGANYELNESTHKYKVKYNGGTDEVEGPHIGYPAYTNQADLESSQTGAAVRFTHTSGTIGIYLFDSPYNDNVAGLPNPTFKLVKVCSGDDTTECGDEHFRVGVRQPITMLYSATTSVGTRRLIAATQNRIYSLNETTNNWRVLSDSLGGDPSDSPCPDRRFSVSQVGDYIIVTNDYDKPQYWLIDSGIKGCGKQAFKPIPDLDLIGLTKAKVTFSFKGVLFFANVEMDFIRIANRIVWGNYNDPLSLTPADVSSIAGFQDLDYGEEILAAAPIRDYMIIYTNKSIWRMAVLPDSEVPFSLERVYTEPKTGAKCLVYPYSLVSLGDKHVYLGQDNIYTYDLFTPTPIREEWLYLSSNQIFDSINRGCCNQPIGYYEPNSRELWFSYPTGDNCCPNKTFVIHTEFRTTDIVDHGFTAFTNYRSDTRDDLRSFLLRYCVCSPEDFATVFKYPEKEGGGSTAPCSLEDEPTSIWNATENPNLPSDETSICAALGDTTIEDLCNDCNKAEVFILASASDYCLKQYGTAYARETCTDFTGSGTYILDSYTSILRSSGLDFDSPDTGKEITKFEVSYMAAQQEPPSQLVLRIGHTEQPEEPNTSEDSTCAIIWKSQTGKDIKCLSSYTASQHISNHTKQPSYILEWPLYYDGRYLYWEIYISDTGGECCFSRVGLEVKKLSEC